LFQRKAKIKANILFALNYKTFSEHFFLNKKSTEAATEETNNQTSKFESISGVALFFRTIYS